MSQTSVVNFLLEIGIFLIKYGWILVYLNAIIVIARFWDIPSKEWRDKKFWHSDAKDEFESCMWIASVWLVAYVVLSWFFSLPVTTAR